MTSSLLFYHCSKYTRASCSLPHASLSSVYKVRPIGRLFPPSLSQAPSSGRPSTSEQYRREDMEPQHYGRRATRLKILHNNMRSSFLSLSYSSNIQSYIILINQSCLRTHSPRRTVSNLLLRLHTASIDDRQQACHTSCRKKTCYEASGKLSQWQYPG